jgi:hypothetical protein
LIDRAWQLDSGHPSWTVTITTGRPAGSVTAANPESKERTMHAKHLAYMVAAGGAAFGVMVLAGVPPATASLYALLLACPLMMIAMMASMRGDDSQGATGLDRTRDPAHSAEPDQPPAGSQR